MSFGLTSNHTCKILNLYVSSVKEVNRLEVVKLLSLAGKLEASKQLSYTPTYDL
jgi:hypothetical protein